MKTKLLKPHPLNRKFPTTGEDWQNFLTSIEKAGGVLVDIIARKISAKPEAYEVLAGHRRLAAAKQIGLTEVPVRIVEMDDEEALEFLINENMQRCDLSPADEARFVAALHGRGLSHLTISIRLSRSSWWVHTRQLMLDLGDEVMERVALPPTDPRHVSVGAIEAVGNVPQELQPEALQMVLHPEMQESALNERQAKEILRRCLVEPWQQKAEWETARKDLEVAARKALKDAGFTKELLAFVIDWDDRAIVRRGSAKALDLVPDAERTDATPPAARWADLALRHGLSVRVVPPLDGQDDAELLVAADLIRQAEAARADHGEVAWLCTPGKLQKSPAPPAEEKDDEDDHEEPAPEALEGTVETYAQIKTTEIRRIGKLAMALESDPTQDLPDWVPPWVSEVHHQCGGTILADIVTWMMDQRAGA